MNVDLKKILLFLFVFGAVNARAQQQYVTLKGIHYYADSINNKDSYTASQCKLDLYYPKDKKDFATIIWVHGGSLTGGFKEIPTALMNKGYAVVGVEYRLSPKVKAPAYFDDATAAVAWVFQHIGDYGGSKKLIFLSGHSAGAYLMLMVTLNKQYLARYNIDANNIAGLIPFSGEAMTHLTIRAERDLKNMPPLIDEMAPAYYVRPDAPPILLITGDAEKEHLGRYEENAYLYRMMKLAGQKRITLYQLQGFDHGGMAEPAFPLLLKEVGEVSREIMGDK